MVQPAKDITIQAGAGITINPGFKLQVCGDYVNSGNLTADPTSIVEFVGTGVQSVSGALTGANQFGNFYVTKTSGVEVDLNGDVDIAGDFIITTGRLDCNDFYMKVGGDFTVNEIGSFIHRAGTVEFNGTGVQNFYIQR